MTMTFTMFVAICAKVRRHHDCRTGTILCSATQDQIFIVGSQCIVRPADNEEWEGR